MTEHRVSSKDNGAHDLVVATMKVSWTMSNEHSMTVYY